MICHSTSTNQSQLLEQAGHGDRRALNHLFSTYTPRLERRIALRLDRRLRSRMDVSDVVQEVYLEAARRFPEYVKAPGLPFFLWLGSITTQTLIDLYRFHLKSHVRDARREVILRHACAFEMDSPLDEPFRDTRTGPSEDAAFAEIKLRLHEGLNHLNPRDRAVIVLRNLEQLTWAEIGQVLGLQKAAARKRHLRALKKLRDILIHMPGGRERLWGV